MTGKDANVKATPLWCSCRLALTIMGFFGFVNLYALRVNMSVAIVCMVQPQDEGSSPDCLAATTANPADNSMTRSLVVTPANTLANGTTDTAAHSKDREVKNCTSGVQIKRSDKAVVFDWDKKTRGLVLGSFFWGYMVTQVPGGWLSGRYGGKHVFGWCMLLCAIATLLMPLAARAHVAVLMALRIIAGLGQGVVWPAMQDLWAHWAPPLERSKLSGFGYAGAQIGNVLTFPLCGLLCDYGFDGGWPSIFYTLGILGVIWFIFWMFIVYDSPTCHPRISPEERDYIVHSLKRDIDVSKKSTKTPWAKIFTSLPVWAIIVTHACANWGTYTFLTNIPSYLNDVFGFQMKKAGFLSALPYIGFWAMTNVSGQVADLLRTKGIATTTSARKLFNSLGTLVPAAFVLVMGFMDNEVIAITLLTIGVAMSGCQYGSGFIVNPVDVAPRYAGIIFGISNTTGTLGGVLAPLAIGILTQNNTRAEWQTVFIIAAGIYTVGAIFYIIFGSGEVQEWALDKDTNPDMEIYIPPEPSHVADGAAKTNDTKL